MKNLERKSESVATAKKAGLIYVNDSAPGFKRIGTVKKFKYIKSTGNVLRTPRHLARIESLVIPPAWQKVWISAAPRGHIQVTGFDVRGRKQYRYHSDWNDLRNEKKFSRMTLFATKLPLIRAQIKKDLKQKNYAREKIIAAVVKIMERTLIRVGNDEYAKSNHSYGLTTIRNRHVKVKGSKIIFDFKGKSGKQHHVEVEDPHLAKIVRRCQELPGQELFGYRDERGRVQNIHSQHVNQYLQDVTGEKISAKDFRTWGGTVCAALFLGELEIPKTKKGLKKIITETVNHTSETLRNTPSICKKYYIHPHVFDAFEKGHLTQIFHKHKANLTKKSRGLFPEEVFTKRLLESFI